MKLTSDQLELRDLIRRFFADAVSSEYLRKRMASGIRRDVELLASLSQLGLEEGFGAADATYGFRELALVAEEIGRSLLPEPLSERLFGDTFLPRFLSESARGVFQSLGSRTAFVPGNGGKLMLNSKKRTVSGFIPWAFGVEGADRIVAPVPGNGPARYVVFSLQQPSVQVKSTTSLDLTTPLSEVSVKDCAALVLGEEDSAFVEDGFEVLKACEVSGIAAKVVEMTTDYVKTREQFGVPIGAFQAIQQRLADAYAASESLAALCRFSAWSVQSAPAQRRLTSRAAIAHASEVGPAVCEAAVQCHGGIGFTWEYDLHLYLRRAKVIQAGFGLSAERADELLRRAKASAA